MLQVSQAFDIGRAISHGWSGVKRQPVGLLLGSLLLTITEGGGGGGGNPMGGKYDWGEWGSDHKSTAMPTDLWGERLQGALGDALDLHTAGGIAAALVGLFCLLICVTLVVVFRCWIEAGYLRTQRDLVITGAASAGTLFSGAADLGRLLLWKLLRVTVGLGVFTVAALPAIVCGLIAYLLHAEKNTILILVGIVAFVCVVPTLIYVGIGLALGDRAVVIDGLGPAGGARSLVVAREGEPPFALPLLRRDGRVPRRRIPPLLHRHRADARDRRHRDDRVVHAGHAVEHGQLGPSERVGLTIRPLRARPRRSRPRDRGTSTRSPCASPSGSA